MPSPISLIAIDLDGTLLTPEGTLTERNAQAVRRAVDAGVVVVLATGKSRSSAEALLSQLDLQSPGVFTQGLLIYDETGAVWHETALETEVAAEVIRFAEERELPYFAYAGTRLLTREESDFRQALHHDFHEPLPEIVGSVLPTLDDMGVNKVIVCDPSGAGEIRAALTSLVAERAHVTQAVPYMVEVLPAGSSKGAGLRWLLEQLDIPAEQVMAIGDGENDVEMLELAGIGIAMGNAHPRVKATADQVVASNRESGVAEAIERFVLQQEEGS